MAITEEQVSEALSNVIDPELGFNIVDLGLVYNVQIDGPKIYVEMTLTSMACPAGPQIVEAARTNVLDLEGVEDVEVNLTFTPPWGPDKMREELRWIFGR